MVGEVKTFQTEQDKHCRQIYLNEKGTKRGQKKEMLFCFRRQRWMVLVEGCYKGEKKRIVPQPAAAADKELCHVDLASTISTLTELLIEVLSPIYRRTDLFCQLFVKFDVGAGGL